MILLQILSKSLNFLCSSSILEILMVPECWCVVSGQVEIGLKSVALIGIEVLCLLNLVGTLMGWSLFSTISFLSFIYYPYFKCRVHYSLIVSKLVH